MEDKLFLVLKPEARKYLETIESFVERDGFEVSSKHPVRDWHSLCLDLYAPQLEDPKFRAEFNAYSWLSNNFFGNSAAVFMVDSTPKTRGKDLVRLADLKQGLRTHLYGIEAPIQILIDMDKLNVDGANMLGYQNSVKINGRELTGKWEDFYFKYIHVPDPEISVLERELKVLSSKGILDKQIPYSDWIRMRNMGSLVCP